jgi:CubicO group peptidase (beta-lactamase class C family)
MTALAAMLVVFAASPPSYARELQRLETSTPEQLGMSSARLERIAEALKKEVSDGKLPGAVVIVARKGKIVYSGATGFQDKAGNKPMAANSIFRIYR